MSRRLRSYRTRQLLSTALLLVCFFFWSSKSQNDESPDGFIDNSGHRQLHSDRNRDSNSKIKFNKNLQPFHVDEGKPSKKRQQSQSQNVILGKIRDTTPKRLDPNGNKYELSNPLENSCKYPITRVHEPDIAVWNTQPRTLTCQKLGPEFATFYPSTSTLYTHGDLQTWKHQPGACYWRAIGDTLYPHNHRLGWIDDWTLLTPNQPTNISASQFVVACYASNSNNGTGTNHFNNTLYRRAFAQVQPLPNERVLASADGIESSLDIIVVDSTSLSQWQRHAPRTWALMRDHLHFEWLEGYHKVGDNSMPNLMPILTGLRHYNQSKALLEDLNQRPINVDELRFLWHEMKNAVTMWNDDIMHYGRGLFHYPEEETTGFGKVPTDYYYRPWHVYNYRYAMNQSANPYCLGTTPYHQATLSLTEQFIARYSKVYHFSFTFLTSLTHDNPSSLAAMDDHLYDMLTRLHQKAALAQSTLVIMGDHGNRVHASKSSFTGRVEERRPFMAIRPPDWFREQNLDLMKALRINRHRLTANFDVHQTLLQLITGRFEKPEAVHALNLDIQHGQSLFTAVSPDRTCEEADIPPQHCTCQILQKNWKYDEHALQLRRTIIDTLGQSAPCVRLTEPRTTVKLTSTLCYSINQFVRHGIRYFDEYYERTKGVQAALEVHDYYIRFVLVTHPPNGRKGTITTTSTSENSTISTDSTPITNRTNTEKRATTSNYTNTEKHTTSTWSTVVRHDQNKHVYSMVLDPILDIINTDITLIDWSTLLSTKHDSKTNTTRIIRTISDLCEID